MDINEIKESSGKNIEICGCAYRIRKASGLVFVFLRHGKDTLQAVYVPGVCTTPISELPEGAYIKATASVKEEKRSENGIELTLKEFSVISKPVEEYPLAVSQPTLGCTLDANISNRTTALRHPSQSAIMGIRSTALFAFEEFMQNNSFTHISTPKISPITAEKEYIQVRYFDTDATLSKSHTPYLIMSMGGFDKVYTVGECYSSKNRNSIRHLNEFTQLAFETAYESEPDDICKLLTDVIAYVTEKIVSRCQTQLKTQDISLEIPQNIPKITYSEAKSILCISVSENDLDPTDERKLCQYALENFGTSYVFITKMPAQNRPFYEKPDTGFVLLYNGIEIASGGEHISDYNEQRDKLVKLGVEINSFESFLSAHKYSLPPIGGAKIGLERLIMQLLNLENIRLAVPFPRDLHYIL